MPECHRHDNGDLPNHSWGDGAFPLPNKANCIVALLDFWTGGLRGKPIKFCVAAISYSVTSPVVRGPGNFQSLKFIHHLIRSRKFSNHEHDILSTLHFSYVNVLINQPGALCRKTNWWLFSHISDFGEQVLAWGNSVGDLVADVVIARAGQPKMAVAGCYAGPMFNMLIGLGLALAIKTTNIYPNGYKLPYHPNVPISFGFLFACLLGSLAAVALSRFRITRPWGVCLITLYVLFMAVSILVELQWIRLDYHA